MKNEKQTGSFTSSSWCSAGRGLRVRTPGGGRGRLVGTAHGREWFAYDDDGEEHFQEMCAYFDSQEGKDR